MFTIIFAILIAWVIINVIAAMLDQQHYEYITLYYALYYIHINLGRINYGYISIISYRISLTCNSR